MEARQMMEAAGHGSASDMGYVNECVTRWKKTKLLESFGTNDPINNRRILQNTAVLLENQKNELMGLNEDTTTSNMSYFTKYTFPVLRRVWPNLIANQLVSVQPTTTPMAGIFFFEKVYSDAKGAKTPSGGITNDPTDMAYDGKLSAGDNMQQNLAKNYSSEFVDYDDICTNTGTGTLTLTQAGTACAVPAWGPIRDNGTLGQRTFSVKLYYRVLDADNSSAPLEMVATMNDAGVLYDNASTPKICGSFDIATGAWSLTGYGSGGGASAFATESAIYAQYYINWEQVGYTTGASIPTVDIKISMFPIVAEKRPLKARWSVEAAEDMKNQNGVDAEAEIVEAFSNEVLQEIDRGIIDELVAGAYHHAAYEYTSTAPGELESIRQSLTVLGALSASINKATLRSGANFVVAGPEFCSLLDQLSTHGDYASIESNIQSPSYGPMTSNFGIARVGTLLRKWAVYCNPHMDSTKVLIGLKGNTYWDAGFVYAPYVPLSMTPTFLDPNDQTNRKGAWTRYASKMLRNEYYGVMTVSGLPSVTVG